MDIFSLSREYEVVIDIEWIPRTENEAADYLSKIVDFDDWNVEESYFRAVDSVWGPLQSTALAHPRCKNLSPSRVT